MPTNPSPAVADARLLSVARELLSCPTAPFHEEAPAAYVRKFAAGLGLSCTDDRCGNLLVEYRKGRPEGAVTLVAHLDHPGFEVHALGGGEVRLRVFGNVPSRFLVGSQVRCFNPDGSTARVQITTVHPNPATGKVAEVSARVRGKTELGAFGMFDLPGVKVDSRFIRSRVLDNLAGCVAMCGVLERLVRSNAPAHLYALFTRAEEVGFAGAVAAAHDGTVPRDAPVISIEMSRRRPHGAVQGKGFVIRVGDKRSIFDGEFTGFLLHLAQTMAERERGFQFQKRIMDGGTCEATSFQAGGYRASGVVCPLGNYHNEAAAGIGREYIRTSDFLGMTRFLDAVCRRIGEWPGWLSSQRDYAMEAYRSYGRRLAKSAPLGAPPVAGAHRLVSRLGAGR